MIELEENRIFLSFLAFEMFAKYCHRDLDPDLELLRKIEI